MNKSTYILSRSSFAKGLHCSKQLFLSKNQNSTEEDKYVISDEQRVIKKRTNYLRSLAQKLYPKGVDAQDGCSNYAESANKTKQLVKHRQKIIYNAVFIEDDIAIVIDMLVWKSGSWKAYEIKTGTKISKSSFIFAAFKWYALTKAKIFVNEFSFVVLNKNYYKGDVLHFTQCFKRISSLTEIKKLMPLAIKKIKESKEILASEIEPEVTIGKHCIFPYDCRFKSYCWKDVPETSVLEIVGLNNEYKFQLYQDGFTKMEDLLNTEDAEITAHQKIQIKSEVSGEAHVDKEKIKEFLDTISYPLHFLDFESYQPFLPREKGMNPLQQCVFQYSLHKQEDKNSELIHQEFLALPTEKEDIRLLFLQSLLNNTAEAKSILVYDVSFEKYYLTYLAKFFPKYKIPIQKLMDKMVDLMQPFAQKYIYTPEMKGLHSIKAILPALIPAMDYKELDLQNGLMASLVYAQWCEGTNEEESEVIEKKLKEYCALDTFAMTKILTVLKGHVDT